MRVDLQVGMDLAEKPTRFLKLSLTDSYNYFNNDYMLYLYAILALCCRSTLSSRRLELFPSDRRFGELEGGHGNRNQL